MTMDQTSSSSSTRYHPVIHRKVSGSLEVTETALVFVNDAGTTHLSLAWTNLAKHQVSPVTYPKPLLKLVFYEQKGKPATFQLASRDDLERIRADISNRLQLARSKTTSSTNTTTTTTSSTNIAASMAAASKKALAPSAGSSFGELDPTALAVTRSSLLAANPSLRAQHYYLVQETKTVGEEDFWKTHNDMLEEEYARISGMTKAGSSSLLQSHLQLLTGRVTLGVEEMRQIFILYPAVHKAYEEKVPLELSDEQFWRKYLESEYFHRDRGRLGAASRNATDHNNNNNNNNKKKSTTQSSQSGNDASKKDPNQLSVEEREARAAAVGTDDLFSRYDQKLNEASKEEDSLRSRKWGTQLAVGQFDLASTFETERGQLLEGPRDNHPANAEDAKGTKVIQKYNRHWAMVMHPEDAVAGSDLMRVAKQSVQDVLPNDDDAQANGGITDEMFQLVGFAEASSEQANHARGIGLQERDEYEELTLKNVEAYYSGRPTSNSGEDPEEIRQRNGAFASAVASKVNDLALASRDATKDKRSQLQDAFPPPQLGKELLSALTKKMAADSKTEEDALAIVNSLPEDFKKKLHSYFRRSSELLRHFFGLRKLAEAVQGTANASSYAQKQQKIVTGMESVYREMDEMRKGFEATGETGELMRKMCLQIMDQLDWAFQLHREGTGGGGGGGFVTIEEF